MSKIKINKTSVETRLAIERRSAAMLPDRPTQAGFKPWDIRNALFSAIIADKGACLMGEIDRIVDETNAAIDAMRIKSGTLTVPLNHWKGEETPRAECVMGSIYTAGCAVLFMPEDDETKEQARLARLSMAINETMDGEWSDVVVFVGEGGEIPSVDLHFRYIVIPTESETDAIVALVGVDAYGEGGTTSGVDEEAVKALISKEVPEWARAKQKPEYTAEEVKARPVTWTPTAAEIGARPSTWMPTAAEVGARPNTWTPTAGEVGAESAGKVKDHNEDSGSHTDIRLDITTLRTMLNTVIGTDTGKSMRAVAALVVAEIVGDASDSFDTLEEIAAWIEAHPNDVTAMVKRITDLETAMGGKVSKTDIINTLDSTALDKPLSAAMGAKLNALLTEMSDELDGKATPEQVTKAISDALAGYAPKDHNHDDKYLTQHQSLDHLLPKNQGVANADKLMAVADDGSVTYIAKSDLGLSGDIIVSIDDDKNIVLTGDLAPGTYTFLYLVRNADGTVEAVNIGTYTVEEETPETKTYTVKWVNYDGTVLETDTVTEGETPVYNGATPTRAADDRYTYAFAGWNTEPVAAVADATYTATYTQTAKPEEPSYTNLLDGVTIYENKKMSTSTGDLSDQAGARATDFIEIPPEQVGDTLRIYNVSLHASERVNNIIFYNESKTKLGSWLGVSGAFAANVEVNDGVYSFIPADGAPSTRYIRFSCGNIDENSIVTLGEEIV